MRSWQRVLRHGAKNVDRRCTVILTVLRRISRRLRNQREILPSTFRMTNPQRFYLTRLARRTSTHIWGATSSGCVTQLATACPPRRGDTTAAQGAAAARASREPWETAWVFAALKGRNNVSGDELVPPFQGGWRWDQFPGLDAASHRQPLGCRSAAASRRRLGIPRVNSKPPKRSRTVYPTCDRTTSRQTAATAPREDHATPALSRGSRFSSASASSFACCSSSISLRDVRQLELRQAVLAGAEEFAGAAQLQVHLGDLEAVVRVASSP